MPRDFTMQMDSNPVHEYGCRESAADTIKYYATSRHTVPDAKVLDDVHTLIITFPGVLSDIPAVLTLLQSACVSIPLEMLTVESKSDGWNASQQTILRGKTAHVYHAMWWCVLLMRLILEDGIAATPVEQLRNASLTSNNWYGHDKADDKADAITAFNHITELDAARMFQDCRGPSSYYHKCIVQDW